MALKDAILIVDDVATNRKLLARILSEEYDVLTAENGREALSVLEQHVHRIKGIMLDLMMPVMDGYEFLNIVAVTEEYKNIPVIVTTGNSDVENEAKALEYGAWDFVSKPYHADIIKFRVKNAIERSQLAAFHQLKYLAEYDALTGIYNKTKFFDVTQQMLRRSDKENFVFIRFDINHFSLINSFYGMEEGDRLLKRIGSRLRVYSKKAKLMTYGRIEADIFVFCTPYCGEDSIHWMINRTQKEIKKFRLDFDIVPTFGIYKIEDRTVPINKMYDYANLAAKQVKGNYFKNYAMYTEEMSKAIESEQEIVNQMSAALAKEQFVIYLQPKYSLETQAPAGAEALVRWNHPEKGMISPAVFIPVFERNGFISKLDYYVWEKICALIKKWLDEGTTPYPISVNVSRVNLYNAKLVDSLCELTDRYAVPRHLLQLELTESVYTDNPQVMMDIMQRLHNEGFVVLMDDFGSGYSSLNMLKDIEVDVIKIDMRFFDEAKAPGRAKNIIASIVRMTKWLNIPTVAEGVEKAEQVEFLHGIGCEYVQGYYFARPMPVEECEKLLKNSEATLSLKEEQTFNLDSIWAAAPQVAALFSSITQAVGIYEFSHNDIDLLRVNQAFYRLFGYQDRVPISGKPILAVDEKFRQVVIDAFNTVVESKGETQYDYLRLCVDGRKKWVRCALKYLSKVGSKHILVGSLQDITLQKEPKA